MSKCCECCNPYYLGCFAHCGDIKFPAIATISGLYLLYAHFNGTLVLVDAKNLGIGDEIVFSLQNIAENYSFQSVYIEAPDGTIVSVTVEDTEYNCFSFKTQIVINVSDNN